MRRRQVRNRPGCRHRAGFTLIELLVIIAIIAALMALSASAVIKFMAVQQSNNTQTVMNKLQSALNRQWGAAKDQAWKEAIPGSVDNYIRNNKLAGTDANVDNRVRVIYVKLKLRQMFPMNFGEALNVPYQNPSLGVVPASPVPPYPGYIAYLNQYGITPAYVGSAAYTPQRYESAVCLLMALQRGQSGGGANTADIGGGGSTTTFALPNGKGIPMFADAWGQPLYFTRVPAGCSSVNPPPSNTVPGGGTLPTSPNLSNDQGDPQGYLNSTAWPKTANTTLFKQLTQQPLAGGTPSVSFSYKLPPLIASSGPNGKLEVDPTWFSGVYNDDLFTNP